MTHCDFIATPDRVEQTHKIVDMLDGTFFKFAEGHGSGYGIRLKNRSTDEWGCFIFFPTSHRPVWWTDERLRQVVAENAPGDNWPHQATPLVGKFKITLNSETME